MATLIDLVKNTEHNISKYLRTGWSRDWFMRYEGTMPVFQVIIAKGNVFEGIEAKW